ncbi:beta-lactamase/transpeptidase-like protein [Hypoxylon sp. NC1633]|nr:beta-lactamase/transpeptidase-like protein [Hypoxylon sp. NC1633]
MRLTRSLLGASPLLLVLFHDAFAVKNNHCPPVGPVLPAPTSPSTHPVVQSIVAVLKESISNLTGTFNGTAVSVGMKSLHETAPILDAHYTPPVLDPRGASQIDASTVYRIGSVSKVFAVLAVLKTRGVRLDDPITKYLPQLRELKREQNGTANRITAVDWDDVTLHALASHMGGIGADMITDLTSLPINWTALGLPPAREVLDCSGYNGFPPCNATIFWDNFGKRNPVFAPYSSPLYSNTAFFLLSLVVESVSGVSYGDFVQTHILDAVGMKGTTYTKPDDKLGAISLGDITWNSTLGIDDPSGAFYSNTQDLLAFGTSILTNQLLTPMQTRRWLKPVTFTASAGLSVGAPWEILRSANVTTDQRQIEFYTKDGDVGTYHALLCLIPDYDLVVTVLTAGPQSSSGAVQLLFSQAVSAVLPAVEAAGKDEARRAFAGEYVDPASNSSLTLAVDDEGPGLAVGSWVVRGTDVLAHWLNYLVAVGGTLPTVPLSARVYPSGLTAGPRTAWRVVVDLGTPEQIAQSDALLFWPQGTCLAWGSMDRVVYQFEALDELVFDLADTDSAVGVEVTGFGATLVRS